MPKITSYSDRINDTLGGKIKVHVNCKHKSYEAELVRSLEHERSVTAALIEHVMRFLVALSDRVLIMHHGQKIHEGLPKRLPKDRTVVEVYLGKGTAERLQHAIEEERAHGTA